jgi:hypothetical protein
MSNYYCLVKYRKMDSLMRCPFYECMQLRNYGNRLFDK